MSTPLVTCENDPPPIKSEENHPPRSCLGSTLSVSIVHGNSSSGGGLALPSLIHLPPLDSPAGASFGDGSGVFHGHHQSAAAGGGGGGLLVQEHQPQQMGLDALAPLQPQQQHPLIPNVNLAPVCTACRAPIFDRFYMTVGDSASFHENCLRCCVCHCSLDQNETCFWRDNATFCRDDYWRKFTRRCGKCRQPVLRHSLVMWARDECYHAQCFRCIICSSALVPGETYGVGEQGALYCQSHYEPMLADLSAHLSSCAFAENTGDDGMARDGNLMDATRLAKSTPRTSSQPPSSSLSPSCLQPVPSAVSSNMALDPNTPGSEPGGMSVGETHSLAREVSATLALAGLMGNSDMYMTSYNSADMHDCTTGNNSDARSTTDDCDSAGNLHGVKSPGSSISAGRLKRMRTSFKHHQLRTMKAYFQLNHNPDAKDLKQLAQKTGLTKRVLQVWFQNARAKYRRAMQLRPDEAAMQAGGAVVHPGVGFLQHQQQMVAQQGLESGQGMTMNQSSSLGDDMGGHEQTRNLADILQSIKSEGGI